MSGPNDPVTIDCPSCGHRFETSFHGGAAAEDEDFDPSQLEMTSQAMCPACGAATDIDGLVVDDGVFHFPNE